jgi:signal transduction histidine kinase
MLSQGKSREDFLYHYPFWFLMYLSAGTLIYLLLYKNLLILWGLMFLDYFAVLLYQYFEPCCSFLELLWLPGILTVTALVTPGPWYIPLTLIMGIPGVIFLNYGYHGALVISAGESSWPYHIGALFFYVPVTLGAVVIGHMSFYTGKLRDRTNALDLVNAQLNKINRDVTYKMFSLRNDTTLEERERISKEIHDTAGYVFINLIMMLQAASAVLYKDIEKAANLINDARDYAERGINEIRHILRNIRDYTPVPLSLQNELFDIGKSFMKATDVALTIDYGIWPKTFSKNIDSFFMSFMQEALTNALKHGHATAVSIICLITPAHIVMSVADNGKGANLPVKKGIGITAMEEFVKRRNGAITIQSGVGGFKISAAIPIDAPEPP